MSRRISMLLVAGLLIVPAGVLAIEWEEDYPDPSWEESAPPPDEDYPVSVDMDASASVSFDTFHGSLAPYGEWVVVGSYGRVWRPHVHAGWRPYYYGQWEWTSEGWLWASDEPWGWAAYHYGRWAHDPYQGWVWVPGYQWAPAWVSWRYSGDVVGWAPLAPGVSVYVSVTPYVDTWWTFVPCNRFVAVPVSHVAFSHEHAHRYFRATVPAPAHPGGYRGSPGRSVAAPAWGGPPRRAIEQRIGRPVAPVRVVSAPTPGATRVRSGEVAIYRPERAGARTSSGAGARPQGRDARSPGAPAPWGRQATERPGVQRASPPASGFDRSSNSRPAHAARGDEGRPPPRVFPGPATPGGAGARGQRAWTPEPRSQGSEGRVIDSAPLGRPEPRGSAPAARPEGRVGGGFSPAQPRMQRGGEPGGRSAGAPPARGERRR